MGVSKRGRDVFLFFGGPNPGHFWDSIDVRMQTTDLLVTKVGCSWVVGAAFLFVVVVVVDVVVAGCCCLNL